ncbi:NfeD family protein [Ferrimonas marina]|uniref:NfeD-like C-terminal domain-containing protein n=1 Tax=Ferrimonas marina TaxID=299255 RepID=A0A1M5YCY3_9GAMM|nr:NfeD family protein [Ferrimonas marina]SHI09769.1 hypothetical protein SAMN02745129_4084 [Ferrimonas marina]
MLASLSPWHWLILALVLMAFEALGTGGFLLGIAIAAAALAALTPFVELGWASQLALFALGSLLFTVIYWKGFRRFNEQTNRPDLNNRAAQLVGRSFTLEQDLAAGDGHLMVGDTRWRVRSEQPLSQGTLVVVSGYDAMVLLIEPKPQPPA